MKLQQFDGGVATRLEPQLLNNNQGVIYENIDNAKGVLVPVKDKLATGILLNRYHTYFDAEDEWLSAEKLTDYLEFQRKMYLTDRVSRPQKYYGGVYNFLGIEAPENKCGLTNVSKAVPLQDITVLNKTDEGNLPASDFDYLLFNVKDGVYSTPFKFTVYASTTTATRSNGEVVGFNELTRFGRNPITTEDDPTNRAVQFKQLKGELADSAILFRFYDGAWRQVFEFTSKSDVFLDKVFDISSANELDEDKITPFNGTYQYLYTFYNSDDGTESAPSPLSDELTATSGNIDITLPDVSTDPQVTKKRLYRVGGNITQFTLVVELDANITTYLDKLKDTDLDGRLLESDNFNEAPIGLQFLSESYAMLFGAIGSSLRFTPIGKPNAWPPEYELQFIQVCS